MIAIVPHAEGVVLLAFARASARSAVALFGARAPPVPALPHGALVTVARLFFCAAPLVNALARC